MQVSLNLSPLEGAELTRIPATSRIGAPTLPNVASALPPLPSPAVVSALGAPRRAASGAPNAPPLAVLYDGDCPFCTRGARTILRRLGPARVTLVDFQIEGALADYPGVSYEACMDKLHVVDAEGGIFAGAAAIARLVRAVPGVGFMAHVYRVPGIKTLADFAYAKVAERRYRLFGRSSACDSSAGCPACARGGGRRQVASEPASSEEREERA